MFRAGQIASNHRIDLTKRIGFGPFSAMLGDFADRCLAALGVAIAGMMAQNQGGQGPNIVAERPKGGCHRRIADGAA